MHLYLILFLNGYEETYFLNFVKDLKFPIYHLKNNKMCPCVYCSPKKDTRVCNPMASRIHGPLEASSILKVYCVHFLLNLVWS